ncbi:molybdopterin-dependent oxidoreductase [Hippea maritima]|uniref:Molybdopterin oxidoreductase n=1 Tax=Hippea maritima (strain ATCC 700847 / DSM 10411 / MH2) TaxID=760142 RepID=F2LVS7_HIPMA|nr:molybdopterin-dependent oxidoreductase [Hippea maritima]AEA33861.1 molybdopterin oxidoreductase [Hippea maritima DSM 10411]
MDWINHFCAKDCPDTCGFLAGLENGQLKVKANDFEFLEKPFICGKLRFFYEREIKNNTSYSLLDGKRAKEDDLFDRISKLLIDSLKENKRVLYLRGSGNLGYGMFAWDVLLSQLDNVYFVDGSPCDETGIEAHIEDFSVCTNPPITNLEEVDNIVIFGKNANTCSPHLYAYLKELKKHKRIIYIDPIETQTAKLAHEYFRIKPAADGVLANAILNRLGKSRLLSDDPIKLTGLKEDEIDLFASVFESGRTAVIEGYGLQRYSNGKNSIKWLNRLAYLTGNIDYLYYSRSSKEGLKKPKITPKRSIYIADITDYLKNDYFDVIFIVAANPVMSLPDNEVWQEALDKTILIVVDTNFTQTTEYANYFLKVGGMFAQSDIQGSYLFNKTLKKEALVNGLNDITAAKEIAKRLNVKLDLSIDGVKSERVRSRKSPEDLNELILPKKTFDKIRLISLPHLSYLNSQNIPIDLETVYVSQEITKKYRIDSGSLVSLKNGNTKRTFKAKVVDSVKGNLAFVYKSRCLDVNAISKNIPTDTKRGIAFNDVMVEIEKGAESP